MWVTAARVPLRRLPVTTSTVNVSRRFSVAALTPAIAPAWDSGIETILPPTGSWMSFSVFLNRNWKVRSSFASPFWSKWISYSASGSIEK